MSHHGLYVLSPTPAARSNVASGQHRRLSWLRQTLFKLPELAVRQRITPFARARSLPLSLSLSSSLSLSLSGLALCFALSFALSLSLSLCLCLSCIPQQDLDDANIFICS